MKRIVRINIGAAEQNDSVAEIVLGLAVVITLLLHSSSRDSTSIAGFQPNGERPLRVYCVEKLDFAERFGALISSIGARWSAV